MSLCLTPEHPVNLPRTAEHPWYVLRVKSQREKIVASALRQRSYTEFLPLYVESHRWSDRVKEVQVPLFRGYVFCRFDVNYRLPILKVPGVIDIVGFGGVPQPVSEREVAALQAVVQSGLLMQSWPFLEKGHRVVIQRGPLRGVEGIVLETKGNRRLIISVNLLQRSVAVQIERGDVRPAAA
jgi:transcription antitermination factor NusG